MARSILVLLLMIYLSLEGVSSKPTKEVSFVENLDVEYKKNIWTCGGKKCPSDTTGCNIMLRSSLTELLLYETITCVGHNPVEDVIKLSAKRQIDINLEFGGKITSKYNLEYYVGGKEVAKGKVAVKDLSKLKDEFKKKKQNASKLATKTPKVCALSKRSMIIQPDLLSYNDIPQQPPLLPGTLGAASAQAAATGALIGHQQQLHPQPLPMASTKTIQQNSIIIANAGLSYDDVLNDDFQFDMDGHDVMVFLHIQKTGGTSFGRHLVRDLDLKRPCECQRQRKRCYCFRPHRNENWLFSRYSTGWKCGLHADWTELTSCVDQELDKNEGESAKRRYFYITLLREPIARYMSEYRHVKRGATWKGSRHWCLGRQATSQELPPCYKGKDWLDVTIDEFAGCDSNLAANRQTRMLADLALVGCYNKSAMPSHERDRVMLASAKRNLAAMAYFGLTEYQKISQYIFEETFNLRFAIPFEQHNTTLSVSAIHNLRPDQRRHIEELNSLDIELYAFAKNLLFERFEHLKAKDNDFAKRFANLGNIYYKQGVTEFNWDSNIDETVSTEH